jgi:predicted signal transduction protein with EAL and GGDEF domain
VTASLGLALYPQDGADDAPLVHAADAALYRAKEGGRNRVVLSGDRMDAAALPDEYSWPNTVSASDTSKVPPCSTSVA